MSFTATNCRSGSNLVVQVGIDGFVINNQVGVRFAQNQGACCEPPLDQLSLGYFRQFTPVQESRGVDFDVVPISGLIIGFARCPGLSCHISTSRVRPRFCLRPMR